MSDGYVLRYRKVEDNPVLEDKVFDKHHAWDWMIGRANFKKVHVLFNGSYKTLQRGQFHTSIRKLGEAFGWSDKRVARFLIALEMNGMIKTKKTSRGTTITIVNYNRYQNPAHERPQKPTHERHNSNPVTATDGADTGDTNDHTDDRADDLQDNKKERERGSAPTLVGVPTASDLDADHRGDARYQQIRRFPPDVL